MNRSTNQEFGTIPSFLLSSVSVQKELGFGGRGRDQTMTSYQRMMQRTYKRQRFNLAISIAKRLVELLEPNANFGLTDTRIQLELKYANINAVNMQTKICNVGNNSTLPVEINNLKECSHYKEDTKNEYNNFNSKKFKGDIDK